MIGLPFNEESLPAEIRVFLNHIYEYKKGVRPMVLYTLNKAYQPFVERRLNNQAIPFYIQEVSKSKINLFFGNDECMSVIRSIVTCPLNELSPEQDFILGALLGYDLNGQCKRYCAKRENVACISKVS